MGENLKGKKSLHTSFIVIIPKKEGATSIKDYRPISLDRSIDKIISKVFSDILKEILEETMSTSENACGR